MLSASHTRISTEPNASTELTDDLGSWAGDFADDDDVFGNDSGATPPPLPAPLSPTAGFGSEEAAAAGVGRHLSLLAARTGKSRRPRRRQRQRAGSLGGGSSRSLNTSRGSTASVGPAAVVRARDSVDHLGGDRGGSSPAVAIPLDGGASADGGDVFDDCIDYIVEPETGARLDPAVAGALLFGDRAPTLENDGQVGDRVVATSEDEESAAASSSVARVVRLKRVRVPLDSGDETGGHTASTPSLPSQAPVWTSSETSGCSSASVSSQAGEPGGRLENGSSLSLSSSSSSLTSSSSSFSLSFSSSARSHGARHQSPVRPHVRSMSSSDDSFNNSDW